MLWGSQQPECAPLHLMLRVLISSNQEHASMFGWIFGSSQYINLWGGGGKGSTAIANEVSRGGGGTSSQTSVSMLVEYKPNLLWSLPASSKAASWCCSIRKTLIGLKHPATFNSLLSPKLFSLAEFLSLKPQSDYPSCCTACDSISTEIFSLSPFLI